MPPLKIDLLTCQDINNPDAYVSSGHVLHYKNLTILCRKTALDSGKDRPAEQVRTKTLHGYKDIINDYLEDGLTALLIHRWLTTEKGLGRAFKKAGSLYSFAL